MGVVTMVGMVGMVRVGEGEAGGRLAGKGGNSMQDGTGRDGASRGTAQASVAVWTGRCWWWVSALVAVTVVGALGRTELIQRQAAMA